MSPVTPLKEAALEHAVALCRAKPVGVGLMSMPDLSPYLHAVETYGPTVIGALLPLFPASSLPREIALATISVLQALKDRGALAGSP